MSESHLWDLNPGPALYERSQQEITHADLPGFHRESQRLDNTAETTENDQKPQKAEVKTEVTHEGIDLSTLPEWKAQAIRAILRS